MNEEIKQKAAISPMIIGILLVSLGFLLILLNTFNFNYGRFAWPFFIIVPGVVLIVVALVIEESFGKVLIIPASILTAVGLLLLYQNTTNHWESWAYAWTLVGPVSIGLGQFIYGSLKKQTEMMKFGSKLLTVGLIMFGLGFVFFELIVGISGFGLGEFGWPLLLIGLGVLLVAYSLFSQRKKGGKG
jgi:hypothetical protein